MSTIPKAEVILIATMSNGLQIWKMPNKEVGGFIYYSEENGAPLPALVEALISIECLEIILNDMKKTQGQLATDGLEELEKEIADLKLEIQLSDDSIAEHKNTITALQSQCTEKDQEIANLKECIKEMTRETAIKFQEKEKECEELKEEVEWLTRKKQTIFELGMSWRKWAKEKLESQSKQIEELKAENERLKEGLRKIAEHPEVPEKKFPFATIAAFKQIAINLLVNE